MRATMVAASLAILMSIVSPGALADGTRTQTKSYSGTPDTISGSQDCDDDLKKVADAGPTLGVTFRVQQGERAIIVEVVDDESPVVFGIVRREGKDPRNFCNKSLRYRVAQGTRVRVALYATSTDQGPSAPSSGKIKATIMTSP